MPKKRTSKPAFIQWIEFCAAWLAVSLARPISLKAGHRASRILGNLLYYGVGRRRRIALENVRHVYSATKNEREIAAIARRSCGSFIASLFETAKLITLGSEPDGLEQLRAGHQEVEGLFVKAREIHEKAGGCIFVTPHIGNWEFLPYVAFHAGIPLVVVVRPLDNPYLERFFAAYRARSGQSITPKTNSMTWLQVALRQGKSVGLLPDQSTMRAISVDYLGRKATTTPVPAVLAALYHRPIVVVACCRGSEEFRFDGFVSDPIWPERDRYDKAEIFRLTQEMNRVMGDVVLKYPEQYFWMHNRWKTYQSKDDLSL
jgi:KDO2-lipid IV(A) lauroyltransferase